MAKKKDDYDQWLDEERDRHNRVGKIIRSRGANLKGAGKPLPELEPDGAMKPKSTENKEEVDGPGDQWGEDDEEDEEIFRRIYSRSFASGVSNDAGGDNCGIGPGGFQPGNTCARGGSGGGEEQVASGHGGPGFEDHSGAAVARWMGKQGWTLKRAKAALERAGFKVSDATIKTQLNAGKLGQRGAPAKLTAEQIKFLEEDSPQTKTTPKPAPTKKTPKDTSKETTTPPTEDTAPSPSTPSKTAGGTISTPLGEFRGEPSEFSHRVWSQAAEAQAALSRAMSPSGSYDPKLRQEVAERVVKIGTTVRIETENDPELKAETTKLQAITDELGAAHALVAKADEEYDRIKDKYPSGHPVRVAALRQTTEADATFREIHARRMQQLEHVANVRTLALQRTLERVRDMGPPRAPSLLGPAEVKQAVQEAMFALPSSWLADVQEAGYITVKRDERTPPRGSYTDSSRLLRVRSTDLSSTGDIDEAVVIHELLHAVEATDPRFAAVQRAFLERRLADSPKHAQTARYIYKPRPGEQVEVGFKDKFREHYCGKVYGAREGDTKVTSSSHYEVLTMGYEGIRANRHGVTEDSEHMDFVIGVLASL